MKNSPSAVSEMYPLYWTTSKEGIFMRYSHEVQGKSVDQIRSWYPKDFF